MRRTGLAIVISASVAGGFLGGALFNSPPTKAQTGSYYKVVDNISIPGWQKNSAVAAETYLNEQARAGWRLHSLGIAAVVLERK
jgi:hypothetical protein